VLLAQHVEQAFLPQQLVGKPAAALDQPVGVQQQRPARVQPDPRRVPLGVERHPQRQPDVGRDRGGLGPQRHRRRVPGQADERVVPALGLRSDGDRADRGEQPMVVPLADQHLLQFRQHLRLVDPGEHQRPPGHAQQRAERRLVRAVAGDVADDRVHGA
jgi:hypothetical protein